MGERGDERERREKESERENTRAGDKKKCRCTVADPALIN